MDEAESLGDNRKLGEYYMWLGQALYFRLSAKESYHYLSEALALGEKENDIRIIGWASAYLLAVCISVFIAIQKAIRCIRVMMSSNFMRIWLNESPMKLAGNASNPKRCISALPAIHFNPLSKFSHSTSFKPIQ